MKICSVVGARPHFIKMALLLEKLQNHVDEVVIHTGQHYDDEMSQVFFEELNLPAPKYNLRVGSGSHATQTGLAVMRIGEVLEDESPDCVIVYGDTNTTLAGALAASKLNIKVAHVEAGLRSRNRSMPEEINRIVVDHISDFNFCPTFTSVENLHVEGMEGDVTGDVLCDAVLRYVGLTVKPAYENYILFTAHRPENVDNPENLEAIIEALRQVNKSVVFPVHPRTRRAFTNGCELPLNVCMIDPVGYLDMLSLERYADVIVTDSGGVQREAHYLGVPCIVIRNETEWVEIGSPTVGTNTARIVKAVRQAGLGRRKVVQPQNASIRITNILRSRL